jgi:hypothetical protein
MTTTPDDTTHRYTAHELLRRAWIHLLDARIAADSAAAQLGGTRAGRAAELVAKLSYAIEYVQRLRVVVEGDERAEQAVNR